MAVEESVAFPPRHLVQGLGGSSERTANLKESFAECTRFKFFGVNAVVTAVFFRLPRPICVDFRNCTVFFKLVLRASSYLGLGVFLREIKAVQEKYKNKKVPCRRS